MEDDTSITVFSGHVIEVHRGVPRWQLIPQDQRKTKSSFAVSKCSLKSRWPARWEIVDDVFPLPHWLSLITRQKFDGWPILVSLF
jgi:hypothetical protein